MYIYPKDTESKLEFDKVRAKLESYCRLPSSKEMAETLMPLNSFAEAQKALKESDEFLNVLVSGSYFPDLACEDISKEISLLAISGSVLNEKQFLNIRLCVDICQNLIQFLFDRKTVFPTLSKITEHSEKDSGIIAEIDSVIDMHGLVKSSASAELAKIRKNLHQRRREHEKLFQSILNKMRKAGILADTEESFWNGRRVLSVLSENKREIKGIVHGSSGTGKATYIEPGETIEIANEIASLEVEEKQEIRRILKELTDFLRHKKESISQYFNHLTIFDFIRAKAYYAREIKAALPVFTEHSRMVLKNAYHPLLFEQNKKSGKNIIPLDLALLPRKNILVISGPNAGGKSVALKTAGLLQLMIQSGLLVSVHPLSEFGWFRNLLCDIGDSQSIEYELSTYSSRLIKMKHFLQRAGKNTLFLIDEFGTGTDPELGGALAEVILEELAASRSYGIITTHFGNIKVAGENLENTQNACMLFDDDTLEPLYKLETGKPGSSYTFTIAEKSGLNKHLIQRAKGKVHQDKIKLDQILNSLQLKRNQLNEELNLALSEKKKAAEAETKFEQIREKLEAKLEKMKAGREREMKLTELGLKMEMLTTEWEKEKDKKKVIALFVKEAGKQKAKKIEETKRKQKTAKKEKVIEKKLIEIKVGTLVRIVNGGKQSGVVEEIVKKKARVTFGDIKSIISIENLVAVD